MRSARARCGSLFVDRVSIDHSPQDYDVRSTDIAAVETPNCRHSPATLEGPEWVAISTGRCNTFNLDRREADVAIRLIALDQSPPPSLIGRKVGISAATGFATDAYLQGKDLTDPKCGAVWLGWSPDDSIEWIAETPYPHLPVYGVFNHAELQHHAAVAGIGIAYLPLIIGDNDPRLHRIPGMTPKPARDIWVLSHADLRETVRMKALRDWVSQALVSARSYLSE